MDTNSFFFFFFSDLIGFAWLAKVHLFIVSFLTKRNHYIKYRSQNMLKYAARNSLLLLLTSVISLKQAKKKTYKPLKMC